jgi:hypothetical protein
VLFDRGRLGLSPEHFDIRRDRNGLNVFEVLIPGALSPGQELLDRPVISGPRVRVPDRNCKKCEELFPGRRAGARDDGWKRERFLRNDGKFGVDFS